MASNMRTWLVSAAAASGVVAGGAVGLAGSSTPAEGATRTSTPPPAADPRLARLDADIAALTAEEHSLQAALAQAKARLAAEIHASEQSLAAARRAAAAQRRQAVTVAPAPAPVAVAPAPAPSTHTSTGASGTTSHGSDDGGGDDG